jgi:hypothetical protein
VLTVEGLPFAKEDIMDGELLSRNYYDPVRPKRDTRKRLSDLEQEALVRRAALGAAARDAADQLVAKEQLANAEALLRSKGTYDLSEYAKHRSTLLRQSSALESNGDARLEQIHRGFEDIAAITVQQIIYRYGTER